MIEKKLQKTADLNIDWRQFYRKVFALVIPMALQNLINTGVTAVDVVMLGRVGEKVLSGSSLAGQVQFVMMLVFFGLTSGSTVLTAQYWGKRDTDTIEKILGMSLTIALGVAFVFTTAAVLIPGTLMKIYTSDPEIIAEGIKYLRIVGFSYLFMAFTQVYLNIMRSIERVVVATIVYFVSLVLNIIFNGIFIFGMFGCPAMGIRGAALATLIARIAEMMIVLIYAKLGNKIVRIRLRNMIRINRLLARDFMKYAIPVTLNEMMWGLGSSMNSVVIGHLGSATVAANSVAQVARQLALVVGFGVSSATAIYLGRTIGEKKIAHAKEYSKKFLMLSVIVGAIGGLMILISTPFVSSFLVLGPEAKEYMKFMFFVMSYFTLAMSINTTLIVGTLRSGGDTKVGVMIDLGTMWFFSIPFGAIAAFVLHAKVQIVYMILMCDEPLKLFFSIWRYRSFKWLNDVTREKEELE